MSEDKTIKIEPHHLSDEVKQSLVEEVGFNEEIAEKYSDIVWFNEINMGKPTNKGVFDYARQKFGTIKRKATGLWRVFSNRKTIWADIKSVERTDNDTVELQIHHQDVRRNTVHSDTDSTPLANLLEWKGVNKPLDLR